MFTTGAGLGAGAGVTFSCVISGRLSGGHHAVFAGASLHHAVFASASLHHAVFASASLHHAVFTSASLHHAVFTSAQHHLIGDAVAGKSSHFL
ncbi:pentapeptide repeat-containing protein [Deinococcus puniceus]|uniref:pentapeptide repeat-containing protein n=1 Tax=Deinococcus puniceus TaxID=1182568 RepID=UPI0038B365BB